MELAVRITKSCVYDPTSVATQLFYKLTTPAWRDKKADLRLTVKIAAQFAQVVKMIVILFAFSITTTGCVSYHVNPPDEMTTDEALQILKTQIINNLYGGTGTSLDCVTKDGFNLTHVGTSLPSNGYYIKSTQTYSYTFADIVKVKAQIIPIGPSIIACGLLDPTMCSGVALTMNDGSFHLLEAKIDSNCFIPFYFFHSCASAAHIAAKATERLRVESDKTTSNRFDTHKIRQSDL